MLVEEAGLTEEQAAACLALADDLHARHLVRRAVRALGVERRPARRGPRGAGRRHRGLRALGDRRPVSVEADLRIARGLDYYTGTVFETRMEGYERLGSICSAAATTRSPPTAGRPTPASASRSASPGCSCRCSPTACSPAPVGAQRRARRARRRGVAAASDARRPALRARASPRGGAVRPEVRQADPVRRAPRHPLRVVPRRRRRADQVKDIRTGDQVDADPATWTPTADRPASPASSPSKEKHS